ncbi:DUF983 domain-containing protein [Phenylobacterium sp.]|jgi:uncharacterized protein (DUF983 family)|uniref:DUF983 domain-containing protein n=1 Tax=Phenylobacterium sp. TaxID=1871053 RepID=UPI002E326E45|nr:DUF983 domain-containing protein [Phenylobacterium sp.]HEX4709040.1 DUF983 domain-containing protein [Phenylobacterium sp.]
MAEIVHPLRRSLFRGLSGHCPACGKGTLFWKYLKVNGRCEVCDTDLARYPADDGPAYVTILLVGHLVVAPLLFFPIVWRSNPVYSLPIILLPLAALTLALLPRIKGGWIGLMYAMGVKDTDAQLHTADFAD